MSLVVVQSIHQTAKNGGFCEELLSESDFDAVLATFCYDHGAKASKAVQKTLQIRKSIANAPRVL